MYAVPPRLLSDSEAGAGPSWGLVPGFWVWVSGAKYPNFFGNVFKWPFFSLRGSPCRSPAPICPASSSPTPAHCQAPAMVIFSLKESQGRSTKIGIIWMISNSRVILMVYKTGLFGGRGANSPAMQHHTAALHHRRLIPPIVGFLKAPPNAAYRSPPFPGTAAAPALGAAAASSAALPTFGGAPTPAPTAPAPAFGASSAAAAPAAALPTFGASSAAAGLGSSAPALGLGVSASAQRLLTCRLAADPFGAGFLAQELGANKCLVRAPSELLISSCLTSEGAIRLSAFPQQKSMISIKYRAGLLSVPPGAVASGRRLCLRAGPRLRSQLLGGRTGVRDELQRTGHCRPRGPDVQGVFHRR